MATENNDLPYLVTRIANDHNGDKSHLVFNRGTDVKLIDILDEKMYKDQLLKNQNFVRLELYEGSTFGFKRPTNEWLIGRLTLETSPYFNNKFYKALHFTPFGLEDRQAMVGKFIETNEIARITTLKGEVVYEDKYVGTPVYRVLEDSIYAIFPHYITPVVSIDTKNDTVTFLQGVISFLEGRKATPPKGFNPKERFIRGKKFTL